MAGPLFAASSIYDFTLPSIDGKPTPLASFKGKVVLMVNVASQCGYTPQYTALEAIYEKYRDRGFVVLGFPANNFGQQEPGTNAEIKTCCSTKYNVTFPMFSKISVEGRDQNPPVDGRAVAMVLDGRDVRQDGTALALSDLSRLWPTMPAEVAAQLTPTDVKFEAIPLSRKPLRKAYQSDDYFVNVRKRSYRDYYDYDRTYRSNPDFGTGEAYRPVQYTRDAGPERVTGKSAVELLAVNDPLTPKGQPVGFVAPFADDVSETLLALYVEAESQADPDALPWRHAQWVSGWAIIGAIRQPQDPWRILVSGITDRWDAYHDNFSIIADEIANWTGILCLIDFSEITLDSFFAEEATGAAVAQCHQLFGIYGTLKRRATRQNACIRGHFFCHRCARRPGSC